MLTESERKAIRELQEKVERHDQIHLKLNWDMLHARRQGEMSDFFMYDGEKLTGFLAVYAFGNKIEVCGMVDPAYRRKRIFTGLFEQASRHFKGAGKILLNAPADSASAKKWLETITCSYEESEYEMEWEHDQVPPAAETVHLREAAKDDFHFNVLLEVQCFGFTEEEAVSFNKRLQEEHNEIQYIIEAEKPVGKIRVQRLGKVSGLYGFAVLPSEQRKGYGKNALQKIIRQEAALGNKLYLEVSSENEQAMNLYKACGFRLKDKQDYYLYRLI